MADQTRIDWNAALDAYSHAMGNRKVELDRYAAESGLESEAHRIAARIVEVQERLYGVVTTLADADERRFTAEGLEEIVAADAKRNGLALNAIGRAALLRWLFWMCWHEGLLDADA